MILRACAVVVVLGSGGCGSGEGPDRPGAASRTELQWVEAYADWSRDLLREIDRFYRAYQPVLDGADVSADVEDALGVALECAGGFADEVGKPPTARLERVGRLAIEACAELRKWREEVLASLEGDPSEHVLEADRHGSAFDQLLGRAAEHLRRLAGDARPLPVRRRPTPESHVAPPYGRVGGVVSHRETLEARCWSEDDWREVVRVVSAVDPEHYVDYAGIASPGDERISLAPEVCVELAVLAYTDRRPTEAQPLEELASAVLTLAHEAVHVRAPGASEAEVECAALQEVRRTARELGAAKPYADRLAATAWRDVYPENLPEYFTRACRDGGPLDANPESSIWP